MKRATSIRFKDINERIAEKLDELEIEDVNLRKALATFAGVGDEGHGGGEGENEPAKPNEELLESLNESISFVVEFLRKHDFELSQIITETGFAKNAAITQTKEIITQTDKLCDSTLASMCLLDKHLFYKFMQSLSLLKFPLIKS
jgi:hypothetical protein